MKIYPIGALVLAAASLMANAAKAQDIYAGRQLAQTWCSGCHQVDNRARKAGNDAIPSFPSIAQMNSTTAMSLAAFLSTSHGRMPDYALSETEIQNVSAFILSLRKQ
jgi:mono/diheme cytochrome c family protein